MKASMILVILIGSLSLLSVGTTQRSLAQPTTCLEYFRTVIDPANNNDMFEWACCVDQHFLILHQKEATFSINIINTNGTIVSSKDMIYDQVGTETLLPIKAVPYLTSTSKSFIVGFVQVNTYGYKIPAFMKIEIDGTISWIRRISLTNGIQTNFAAMHKSLGIAGQINSTSETERFGVICGTSANTTNYYNFNGLTGDIVIAFLLKTTDGLDMTTFSEGGVQIKGIDYYSVYFSQPSSIYSYIGNMVSHAVVALSPDSLAVNLISRSTDMSQVLSPKEMIAYPDAFGDDDKLLILTVVNGGGLVTLAFCLFAFESSDLPIVGGSATVEYGYQYGLAVVNENIKYGILFPNLYIAFLVEDSNGNLLQSIAIISSFTYEISEVFSTNFNSYAFGIIPYIFGDVEEIYLIYKSDTNLERFYWDQEAHTATCRESHAFVAQGTVDRAPITDCFADSSSKFSKTIITSEIASKLEIMTTNTNSPTNTGMAQFEEVDCASGQQSALNPILSAEMNTVDYEYFDIPIDAVIGNALYKRCYMHPDLEFTPRTYGSPTFPGGTAIEWASIVNDSQVRIQNLPTGLIGSVRKLVIPTTSGATTVSPEIQLTIINLPISVDGNLDDVYAWTDASNVVISLAGLCIDPEGVAITYSCELVESSTVPSWITCTNSNITIDPPTDPATLEIVVVCKDHKETEDSTSFSIEIQQNHAPTVVSPSGNHSVTEGIQFEYILDLKTVFADEDEVNGQELIYTAIGSPDSLSSTLIDGVFNLSGVPSEAIIGSHSITLNISDGSTSIADVLNFTVIENTAPHSTEVMSDIRAVELVTSNATIPLYVDDNGDVVHYAVTFSDDSPLNASWITFDPSTRLLNFTPPDTGMQYNFKLSVTDLYNDPIVLSFVMTVDLKPRLNTTVENETGALIAQQLSSFNISGTLFTDEDEYLEYSIAGPNGVDISSWLALTPPSGETNLFMFEGIYPNYEEITYKLTITAVDSALLTNTATISISIEATCHQNCLTCFGNAIDECSGCESGRYLSISVCGTTCPSGYYANSNTNNCDNCDKSCKKCTGLTSKDCTGCFKNATATYFNYEGECLIECPSGYYGHSVSQECLPCHSFCTKCYGSLSTQCTECDVANRYVLVDPDTCQDLSCPDSTYFSTDVGACMDCGSSCYTCYGPDVDNCLECPEAAFLSSEDTCQTCSEINPGLKYSQLADKCVEICGKGYNLGSLECDDGNTASEDGCDKFCKVETDWECTGGDETTADICRSLIAPTCELSSISETTYKASVVCSELVTFGTLDSGDIEIAISGPLEPYKFKYVINETTGFKSRSTSDTFRIDFEFLSDLIGDDQETITVSIYDPSIMEDSDGNLLETKEMEISIPFYLIALTEEEKGEASGQSNGSIVSIVLTFGTSFLIQFLFGGTIEASWLLLGTLQLMSFLPLLAINMPSGFRQFSKNLAVLNGEPTAFPNIFEYYYDTQDIDTEAFTKYFYLMNFKTSYLLLNTGRKVMIWICMTILMGVSWILLDLIGNAAKVGGIITKIDTKLRYGIIIRGLAQSYLSLTLSSCLNVYTISWSGEDISFSSNVIALVSAVVMIYIPITSFNIIYKTQNLESPEFQKRFKTIIMDLKTHSPLCFHFITVFLFRRAVYACAFVVITEDYKELQVCFIALVTIGMLTYLILIRPYKSMLSSILSIKNEVMLLGMISVCLRFIHPTIAPKVSKALGNLLVSMLISTIALNWGGIVTFGVISAVKARAEKLRLKKRKEALEKFKQIKNFDESTVFSKTINFDIKRDKSNNSLTRHSSSNLISANSNGP